MKQPWLSCISATVNTITEVGPVKILNVWTPEVIENGTQTSAIVDCDFSLDDQDIATFELKWYFRFDPTPIYTWVPPNQPQASASFSRYINLGYQAQSHKSSLFEGFMYLKILA